MKAFYGYFSAIVIVVVALSVLFAGCTQPAGQPAPAATTPAAQAPAPVAAGTGTNAVSLPYGVNLSVPADWTQAAPLAPGIRDYGTTTVNVANFFSPVIVPGKPATYTSFGVDVDQNPGTDFEKYFNTATLAVGKTYSLPIQNSAQSITLKVSGYKTYELDFQTADVRGSYYFTYTGNAMYIFAFKSPNDQATVQAAQGEITDIVKSITINPPNAVVTQHR